MSKWIKCMLSGLGAGTLSGFMGAGGGMILVPLLRDWAGLSEKKAMATSVMIIAPLSALSAAIYCFSGQTDWLAALPYMAGGLLGGILAGIWFVKIPPVWLRRGFGGLLLLGGLRMLTA